MEVPPIARSLTGRAAVSCAAAALLFFALAGICAAMPDRYRLVWTEDPARSATVLWTQDSTRKAKIYWDTVDHGDDWTEYARSSDADRLTRAKGMRHGVFGLSELEPDTAYYFLIRDDEETGRRLWFRTAPDEPERFSFVSGGDSRNHREARRDANRIVASLRPLFVAFAGDFTARSSDEEWSDWLDDWQLTIGDDGRIIPIVPARGNHEHPEDVHDLFATPNKDDYYAISIGGPDYFRLCTLNSNIPPDGAQARWLERDLEEHADVPWKIVQYHHPFRPHVGEKAENLAQYRAWAHLFHDHRVRLAIECDSHCVKRTWPVRPSTGPGSDEGFIRDDETGTVFIGEGCWGAPLRSPDDPKEWTRETGLFNYVDWIAVDPRGIDIATIMVDNAEEVGTVSDDNPLVPPENLDVWKPESGMLVRIRADEPAEPDAAEEAASELPEPVTAE